MAKPKRRRLHAALGGLGEGLANISGLLLQNQLLTGRQAEMAGLIGQRQEEAASRTAVQKALDDYDTAARGITTPENVQKFGPDVVTAQLSNLRRRLQGQIPGGVVDQVLGEAPDLAALDVPLSGRVGDVRKRTLDATAPGAVPATAWHSAQVLADHPGSSAGPHRRGPGRSAEAGRRRRR